MYISLSGLIGSIGETSADFPKNQAGREGGRPVSSLTTLTQAEEGHRAEVEQTSQEKESTS